MTPTRKVAFPLLAVALAACGGEDERPDGPDPVDAPPPPVWTLEPVPTDEELLAVWGRAADDVYAVGWGGTIIHYDGVAWRRETTTATVPLTAVHGRPAPEMPDPAAPPDPPPTVAVGWGGTVLERGPDAVWRPAAITASAAEDLFGVWLGADDSGLAVGAGGQVLGWDGASWTEVDFAVPGEFSGELIEPKGVLKGIWSGNGRRYYLTGSGGASYRSANGYERFEALDTRTSDPLRGIFGYGNDDVYAVGLDSLILRYSGRWRPLRDDGAETLPSTFLFGVWGGPEGDLTAVGWGGVAVRRQGGQWRAEPTGTETDLRGVWIDPETQVAFAVGASGTVLRRDPPPEPPFEPADNP